MSEKKEKEFYFAKRTFAENFDEIKICHFNCLDLGIGTDDGLFMRMNFIQIRSINTFTNGNWFLNQAEKKRSHYSID